MALPLPPPPHVSVPVTERPWPDWLYQVWRALEDQAILALGGTVVSVDVTAPGAGLAASGGPVTVSGTITLALENDLAALEALSGTGFAKRTGVDTWTLENPGTVTSVALTAPAEFAVAGSPVTTSGTLAVTKANQTANTVWAGPASGAAAQPAFRALVAKDVPISTQSLAYAASLTIDASAGERVVIGTLTGNITINAPTNAATGRMLTLCFTQDATGLRTVTYNSVFKTTLAPGSGTANQKASQSFCYDGANWVQTGGSLTWF